MSSVGSGLLILASGCTNEFVGVEGGETSTGAAEETATPTGPTGPATETSPPADSGSTGDPQPDPSTSGRGDGSTSDASTSGVTPDPTDASTGGEMTTSGEMTTTGGDGSTGGGEASSSGGSSSGGVESFCGDGVVDDMEACDSGADNGNGTDPCTDQCELNICGDGYLHTPTETCDDGGVEPGDGCSAICELEACGNGVLDPGEECDDGGELPGDGCSAVCMNEECGNGVLDPGEACDDGGIDPGDGCSATCVLEECGNGVLDPGEDCDDGNTEGDDGCSATCALESCGNGIVEGAEACDDGNAIETDACTSLCQPPTCGDGFLQVGLGEECDDGAGNGFGADCTDACLFNVCGDGNPGPDEDCDDGNLVGDDGCSATCTLEECGNGIVEGPEACDDGNAIQDDACTTLCQPPECGDGITQGSLGEDCDDGDNDDFDACPNDCVAASCGDGVQEGFEQCDEGGNNGNGTSTCTGSCTNNTCGDGYLYTPGEACDDGASTGNGTSTCSDACTVNVCGDGYVYTPSEECDDGGPTADCSASCTIIASAVEVTAGTLFTCALLDTGGVRCFGNSASGELGYGNTDGVGVFNTPADVGDVDVGGDVVDIDSGGTTCAVLTGGSVRCWGPNFNGFLGYGNTEDIGDDETPASAGDVNVGATVQEVAVGSGHTCALLQNGNVRCWGVNQDGQLGYGNTETIGDDETPAVAGDVDIGGTVVQLAAGHGHTCAVLSGGALRCWGESPSGELGYGNTDTIGDDETPASAGDVDVGGNVVQVAADFHTCALLDTGAVRCWGPGSSGRLGYGNTENIGDDETPASAGDVPIGGTAVHIAVGSSHSCAVLDTGAVRCWGANFYGQLGYGNQVQIGDNETPASAGDVPLGGLAVEVTADNLHTCALLDTGAARCWGSGTNGNLGYGIGFVDIGDDETPASVGDVPLSE